MTRTQVIQAPLSGPKTSTHAGSSDWKYSSGWKKVLTVNALTRRRATSAAKISHDALLPSRDTKLMLTGFAPKIHT